MNTFNNVDVFYLSNTQDYSINQLFLFTYKLISLQQLFTNFLFSIKAQHTNSDGGYELNLLLIISFTFSRRVTL
jgi:hypothetical protein